MGIVFCVNQERRARKIYVCLSGPNSKGNIMGRMSRLKFGCEQTLYLL